MMRKLVRHLATSVIGVKYKLEQMENQIVVYPSIVKPCKNRIMESASPYLIFLKKNIRFAIKYLMFVLKEKEIY